MSFESANPVATEILVIRMSRPFRNKTAVNRVMIKGFYMVLSKHIHVSLGERYSV